MSFSIHDKPVFHLSPPSREIIVRHEISTVKECRYSSIEIPSGATHVEACMTKDVFDDENFDLYFFSEEVALNSCYEEQMAEYNLRFENHCARLQEWEDQKRKFDENLEKVEEQKEKKEYERLKAKYGES